MENNKQPQPDYSKGLSREEILQRLMDEPIEVLRIRYNMYEAAKKRMIAKLDERAKNEPELAEKLEKVKLEVFRKKLNSDKEFKKSYEDWEKNKYPP